MLINYWDDIKIQQKDYKFVLLIKQLKLKPMQVQVKEKMDYSGQNLYIGLDVHKKSWHVTILSETVCLKSFVQPPDPVSLKNYLEAKLPGANYSCAYEAGFSGYTHHKHLNKLGIQNIVVNPADVPKKNKHTHRISCKFFR